MNLGEVVVAGTLPALPEGAPFCDMMKSIWAEQKSRGHKPRSVAEIEAERREMSEGWARRQQAIEQLQEERRSGVLVSDFDRVLP